MSESQDASMMTAEWRYTGPIYVKPAHRGIDIDVDLPEGEWDAEINLRPRRRRGIQD